MMMLASMESLLGSFWFAVMFGLGGYIIGNVIPVGTLLSFFKKQ
mgnify:CR=1 FL=1